MYCDILLMFGQYFFHSLAFVPCRTKGVLTQNWLTFCTTSCCCRSFLIPIFMEFRLNSLRFAKSRRSLSTTLAGVRSSCTVIYCLCSVSIFFTALPSSPDEEKGVPSSPAFLFLVAVLVLLMLKEKFDFVEITFASKIRIYVK